MQELWHLSETPRSRLTIDQNLNRLLTCRRFSKLSCVQLNVPYLPDFPFPRRYNSLRLLGYDYHSVSQLCAITLVTDLRRPLFADMIMAKAILASLLSDETLRYMRIRAFTLMPDHLHFLAGVRQPGLYLPNLIGKFKSYTTQKYWKRSREVVADGDGVCLPSAAWNKSDAKKSRALITPIMEWRATPRPEVTQLQKWASPVFEEEFVADAHVRPCH